MQRVVHAVVLTLLASGVQAAELRVSVRDGSDAPVDEAVVWAIPDGASVPPPSTDAVMDQRNRQFVPHVLAVQTGTSVRFPNSDNVRHQVYSFSAPRRFQLPLYEGSPAEPVVFDKPGVVALGCNIHDRMSAFIIVVDTPWFGKTSEGKVAIEKLPAGSYTIHFWHEKQKDEPATRSVRLKAGETLELELKTGGR